MKALVLGSLFALLSITLTVTLLSKGNLGLERKYGVGLHHQVSPPFIRWGWIAIDRWDLCVILPLAIVSAAYGAYVGFAIR